MLKVNLRKVWIENDNVRTNYSWRLYQDFIRRMIFIDPLNLTSHFSQCDFSYQGSLEEFACMTHTISLFLRISDLDIELIHRIDKPMVYKWFLRLRKIIKFVFFKWEIKWCQEGWFGWDWKLLRYLIMVGSENVRHFLWVLDG